MANQNDLGTPFIGKTAEVRDDESHIWILFRQQLDYRNLAHDVVKHGERVSPRNLTDFARNSRVMPMDLDADKTMLFDGFANQRSHSPCVAQRVDECQTIEPIRSPRYDMSDLMVGHSII